jgi:hypothetical protein
MGWGESMSSVTPRMGVGRPHAVVRGTAPAGTRANAARFMVLVPESDAGRRGEMRRSERSRATNGTTTRQARLKREWAGHYRNIPARFWTEAARLAQLVAAEQGPTSADRLLARWPLPDLHFEFRGGTPRLPENAELRTRQGDDPVENSLERRTSERRSSTSPHRGGSAR